MNTRIETLAALALVASLACGAPLRAQAAAEKKLQVVTTLPVLADLVRNVGGDRVAVESLSDPRQDPHFIQPRPTLMKKAHDADAFVEVGLQLELWGEKVVEGSGNPGIQAGQPGRIVASRGISTLELPAQLSREWGDVHPNGNPHVWLDPVDVEDMAANVCEGLCALDAAHAEEYRARLASYQARIDEALYGRALVEQIGGPKLTRLAKQGRLDEYLTSKGLEEKLGGWLAKARPLRGRPIVTYHKSWAYFAARFGFAVPIEIEEKPGIQPSAKHRDAVVELMRAQGVRAILQEVFYERSAGDYLAEHTGAKVVVVPIDVGPEVGAADYFQMIDLILDRLLEAEATAPAATR